MIEQKNIFFYAHHTFEPWDYNNPMIQGIGGSETSQIEMASRLAQRHHNVRSYAPVPWGDDFKMNRNVKWVHHEKATFEEPGIWIIYRCPEVLDRFAAVHDGQEIWFVAQDTFYEGMTEELASRIDRYICLCNDHANYTAAKHPYLRDKICLSSNGINVQLIEELEKQQVVRNPYRMIYTSSPDRGLESLIPIFKSAKEFVPELELHIFYGFDNIDKVIQKMPWVGKMKDSIMAGINSTDGIFWHGRVGQAQLTAEWLQSTIWCYPINFTETSCISCMEAQACNVIPITSPKWALRENVDNGILIDGDAKDPLTKARFVGEIIRVARDPNLQRKLCEGMSTNAKVRFNWERFVDQWEAWMYNSKSTFHSTQYAFQWKYAEGYILNVGCDSDASGFGALGNVVNLDIQQNEKGNVAVISDILIGLPTSLANKFDTVIMGDILEHMSHESAVKALNNAKMCLNSSGKIIITCPSDHRTIQQQAERAEKLDLNTGYTADVSKHHRYIDYKELCDIVHAAGLLVDVVQMIDYTYFMGHGVVCHKGE